MQILYPRYTKKQLEKSLPDIVVHPPEESVSKSLPDIPAYFRRKQNETRYSVSEHEDSDFETCDRKFRDYKSDTDSKCIDWFQKSDQNKPPTKYTRRRRKIPLRNFSLDRCKTRRFSLQTPKIKTAPPLLPSQSHQNLASDSECTETKRMRFFKDFTKPRVIAPESDPSNWLKFKQKQSLSMHNVYSNVSSDDSLTKYHTIHSPCESGMSSRFSRRRAVKKTGSFDEITENRNSPAPFLNKTDPLVLDDPGLLRSVGTQCDNDLGDLARCCCGNKVCSTVVPIQQYLETYFNRTVRKLPPE